MRKLAVLFITFWVLSINAQNVILPVGPGFDIGLRCLGFDTINQKLYAGGDFSALSTGQPVSRIAQWDGLSWSPLGSGVDDQGQVRTLAFYNNELIVGGTFNLIGGISSKGLAKWNGSNWQSLGNIYTQFGNGCVFEIYTDNNDIYIGGCFDSINGIHAPNIAKWDGSSWTSFPNLGGSSYGVTAIIKYNNELYVGGNFNLGVGKADILKFNGSNWVSVGGGLTGPNTWVNDFFIFQNKLFVGGYFQTVNGDPGNNIAIWDGNTWSQPDIGVDPSNVFDMFEFQGELYVGGQILSAGSAPVTYIAKWDGIIWKSIGHIFDNIVTCFDGNSDDLYIGGGFFTVDNDSLYHIAKYGLVNSTEDILQSKDIKIMPNPNQGEFYVDGTMIIHEIEIFDITGKLIETLDANGENSPVKVKLNNISPGIYLVKLKYESDAVYRKIIIN